ncbi:acyltransferase [Dokdonella sp.]|uniref:LpxL/LpxP family acyltransferase n=1 Tax=Dokdonella sp. TaxID=2291710 RepID=UPI001B23917B|nr:acyltransferase [Dokdonella sp.]MBO9661819.1 acyltransferase [Dokdonella sp.]
MNDHWSKRKEGGGRFAIWLIRTIGLNLGRGVARVFLYPITLYFYFRRPYERRVSYAFLERAFGRRANAWQVMRHIHRFAGTILDRVFLLADRFKAFDVRVEGLDQLTSRIRPERGVLLLGAHVGSFEVLRILAQESDAPRVCVVLDTQKTPALTELLHALNPEVARNVIDASRPSNEIVLAMSEAVESGALATLLADRAREHEATVVVDFMGAPAAFPAAPFLLGSLLKVPLVLCLGLYRGGNRYDLYFEAFADQLELPRRAREVELQAVVQRYAARLEHYVRLDPYNWFNWHDFWNLEGLRVGRPARRSDALVDAAVQRVA